MSLYHSCEACGKSVEFGYEKYHDCEYGTKDKREIAALKAEVERLTCLAPQNVNLMIENHDLRKELEIMNHFYCNDNCELDNPPVFHVDRCLRIQALLAAKRDEGEEKEIL